MSLFNKLMVSEIKMMKFLQGCSKKIANIMEKEELERMLYEQKASELELHKRMQWYYNTIVSEKEIQKLVKWYNKQIVLMMKIEKLKINMVSFFYYISYIFNFFLFI